MGQEKNFQIVIHGVPNQNSALQYVENFILYSFEVDSLFEIFRSYARYLCTVIGHLFGGRNKFVVNAMPIKVDQGDTC